MINSKQKGKRGELLWKDKLREHGFTQSYRSQQYCGSANSADVICPELPKFHFEVKNMEKLNVMEAMTQAVRDCGDKLPVVAHKKNRSDWHVTLRADDFMMIVKFSEYCDFIFCPVCYSNECWRNGYTDKRKQRYECKSCHYSFISDEDKKLSKLQKCKKCLGQRKFRGAGNMDHTCDKCMGIGYIEIKEEEKPIETSTEIEIDDKGPMANERADFTDQYHEKPVEAPIAGPGSEVRKRRGRPPKQ